MRPRQLLKTCLLFTAACTCAYGQAGANLQMTIHVYDYAGEDAGELAEAEAFAARILHHAGLRTQWSNCRFSLGGTAINQCAASTGDVTHLHVRLLREEMARKLAAATTMLGMSVLTSRGTFPV